MGLWHHLDNYEASPQCSKSICYNELAPRFTCTLPKEVLFAVIQKEQDEMEESLQPEADFLWKTTSTSELESNQSNVKAETETQKGIFSSPGPMKLCTQVLKIKMFTGPRKPISRNTKDVSLGMFKAHSIVSNHMQYIRRDQI